MDLTDFYTQLQHKINIFLSSHGTFSKIDHILGHKASLSKYKKVEITPCILSDHNGIKLELNNKRNYIKYSNT
jgi:endonuclease/exonuclease/phosphatase family metal-dependent hydrolase